MKHLILTSSYLVIILIFIGILSCNKENPIVTPPPTGYQFDSARYDWKIDTLLWYGFGYNSTGGYFFLDSSNYYMITDNGQFIHHDENGYHKYLLAEKYVIPVCVFGMNKNNIYIGGFKTILGTNANILKLEVFNGSILKDVPIVSDTISDYIFTSLYQRNIGELWIGTNKGIIIKYDGINLIKYSFNPIYEFGRGYNFFEQESELYAVANIFDSEHVWVDSSIIFRYKAENWEIAYRRVYPPEYINFYSYINGFLYSMENDGIYKFNGFDFSKMLNMNPLMFGNYSWFGCFAGSSNNQILIEGPFGQYNFGIYNWNGIKWSKEIKDNKEGFFKVIYIEGRYFMLTESFNDLFIFHGIPKSKFK